MLNEREKQPEMDCQTDFRKESPSAIQSISEFSNAISSSSSSATEVLKEDGHSDGSNFESKSDSSGGPPFRTGRWTPDEKILFLYGLRMFGKGRWKKMSVYLPQRSLVQIKSHAQKVLKRQQAGENIFRRLEENHNEINNLVVQAARQRDALRMAGINVNTPAATKPRKSIVKSATKKKRLDTQIATNEGITSSIEESLFHQTINNSTTVSANHTSDSSVLAAAALCQLSSIGGAWDQRRRDNTTMISGKGQQATI
jgi:SHAQKYF class myb-like DNA-binding protein